MEKKTHDKLYIPLLFFVMLIGLVVSCVFASILLNSKMEKMQETQTINATVSDKYISFHTSILYLTCVPSRTNPAPSDTISSPTFNPSSTIYSRPSLISATVINVETAFPSTTL